MKMDFSIRINRLSAVLELLNKGYDLSTPNLVERLGVSKKIIQIGVIEPEELKDMVRKNIDLYRKRFE